MTVANSEVTVAIKRRGVRQGDVIAVHFARILPNIRRTQIPPNPPSAALKKTPCTP